MPPTIRKNIVTFFTAYILSAFGYEFIFFLMTVYVYDLTHSAINVGIFAALTFIPRLFAPFYGVAVDRYSRTNVLGAASVATALLVAAIGQGPGLLWVYAAWLLISLLLTVIITVRTALMTEIMAGDGLVMGNAAVLGSLNSAKLLAPLLAGLASAIFPVHTLFAATGALYLVVAALSRLLALPGPGNPRGPRRLLPDIAAGLRYIIDSPRLRFLITAAFLWALFLRMQLSLFIVYVKAYLHGGDSEYGLFMTVVGLGSIVGSLAGPWLVKNRDPLTVAMLALSAHYASFMLLGCIKGFTLALITVFGGYVFFYAALVGLHSLRDQAVTDDIRGRVYGSVTAVLTPPAVVSLLGGGYLTSLFSVERVLAGAGLAALATLLLLYYLARPQRAGTEGVIIRQKEVG